MVSNLRGELAFTKKMLDRSPKANQAGIDAISECKELRVKLTEVEECLAEAQRGAADLLIENADLFLKAEAAGARVLELEKKASEDNDRWLAERVRGT